MMINEKMTQANIPEKIASVNPLLTNNAKTTKKQPEAAIDNGKMVVTVATTSGFCVKPMKNSDNKAVEGSPPMKAPNLLLNLNPIATEK